MAPFAMTPLSTAKFLIGLIEDYIVITLLGITHQYKYATGVSILYSFKCVLY